MSERAPSQTRSKKRSTSVTSAPSTPSTPKVLITGVSGGLGRLLAQRLLQAGYEVCGIDRRPWADPPIGVRVFEADIRKRPAEDVFRQHRPDVVVHMATVTHQGAPSEERYRINLGGTQAVFEHCHTYGVKQAVFVGRHTVYGAAPDAPLYRCEDEPPLAAATYPSLSDLVAADLFAASALWRYPEVKTCVLRLVYTLGPSMRGTLASYLGGRLGDVVPMVMGFDPLFQVMHEYDAVEAIYESIRCGLKGTYNVSGPRPIPLSTLCREVGRHPVSVPQLLYPALARRLSRAPLPSSALNHIKYPVVVNGDAFKEATGFEHRLNEPQLLEAFRAYSQ